MDLALPRASMQRRVQVATLLQFADHGTADRATTAAICPGTDRRDLEEALACLVDEGSIQGPTWRLEALVTLAETGELALTARGRLRIDEGGV